MSIPTFFSCRQLIVGTAAQIKPKRVRGTEELPPNWMLRQIDPDETYTTTLGKTLEDLMFYGKAAWLVLSRDGVPTERNPKGLPVRARHVPVNDVQRELSENLADYSRVKYYVINGVQVDPEDVVWFEVGHEDILTYGAEVLSKAKALENAAARMTATDLPAGIIYNQGSELGPDEARQLIETFTRARKENAIGLLQGATYESHGAQTALDLQMIEARSLAATEIARLFSVPVAMVNASPSGNSSAMLYSNLSQNLGNFIKQAVYPYLRCVEQTMSRDDVTASGQSIVFDVASFLRNDPQASVDWSSQLVGAGILDIGEARSFLGLPPMGEPNPNRNSNPGEI